MKETKVCKGLCGNETAMLVMQRLLVDLGSMEGVGNSENKFWVAFIVSCETLVPRFSTPRTIGESNFLTLLAPFNHPVSPSRSRFPACTAWYCICYRHHTPVIRRRWDRVTAQRFRWWPNTSNLTPPYLPMITPATIDQQLLLNTTCAYKISLISDIDTTRNWK